MPSTFSLKNLLVAEFAYGRVEQRGKILMKK